MGVTNVLRLLLGRLHFLLKAILKVVLLPVVLTQVRCGELLEPAAGRRGCHPCFPACSAAAATPSVCSYPSGSGALCTGRPGGRANCLPSSSAGRPERLQSTVSWDKLGEQGRLWGKNMSSKVGGGGVCGQQQLQDALLPPAIYAVCSVY